MLLNKFSSGLSTLFAIPDIMAFITSIPLPIEVKMLRKEDQSEWPIAPTAFP